MSNDKKRNNNRNNNRRPRRQQEDPAVALERAIDSWTPKTALGKQVKAGEVPSILPILESGQNILEAEIVDVLVPGLEKDLLAVGQSKGKFGGGQRRAFKQTQKKTKEGNTPSFTTYAVVGNKNGFVGVGVGKAKETVPAREKSTRDAKLNLIHVPRGSGSWQAVEPDQNSIPFKVTGKCGSITITLLPAPKGTGLVIEKECAKILEMAGIKDVWSKMSGNTKTKINVVKACFDALKNLSNMKVTPAQKAQLGISLEKREAMAEIANAAKSEAKE